ncbi:MAG TPA: ATP-binding protein [Terriglobales bacterium]|nr:ATP-binding protein [Terriglobales bacterium]
MSRERRVLVLALLRRDAALISETLGEYGIGAESVSSAAELSAAVAEGAGACVITEEALDQHSIDAFADVLAAQSTWSDLPIIVLTSGGASTEYSELAAHAREPLGNVTLLERPVRTVTLLSALRSALRARSRQYQIRDELTRRVEAERAVFSSEQRYRSLVEANTNAVWCTDVSGGILGQMPGWEKYTGQTLAEYGGWGWTNAIHPEDRQQVIFRVKAALKDGSSDALEFRLRCNGEYRRVRARFVPVRDENGVIREWVGACTDIEQQKAAEEALIKSEKLAVAGRLAASIAHEINNPLEAVTNLLFLVRSSSSLAEAKELTKTAESELARVGQMVTHTLRFYRQPTQATATNIPELLDSVIALFQPKLTSLRIKVVRDYGKAKPLVCYSAELRQAFANIIANAIDAMPRGGQLNIRIRKSLDWHDHSTEGIRITVADKGPGVPRTLRRDIFEPFFTTKNETGTGLGLWITRELVQKHGGSVRLYSSTVPARSFSAFSLFFPYKLVPAKYHLDTVPETSAMAANDR